MELVVRGYGVGLGYSRGAVVIRRRDGEERIPLYQVKRIWVLTSGVTISSKLVRACSRNFIDIVYFDGRGNPVARVFPPEANGVVAHRRAQYEAYLNGRGFDLARRVVYGKVVNQASALRRLASAKRDRYGELASAASKLVELSPRVFNCYDPQCVIGVEGTAAQIYWSAISSAYGLPSRDHNAVDPFNLALNYGYGLLKYEVWRQSVIHGLDPYAGYLHVDKSGRPSLVLDLMEEFRPHVDLMVIKARPREDWVEGGILSREARGKLVELWLKLELERVVAKQVSNAVAHLEGRREYVPHRL